MKRTLLLLIALAVAATTAASSAQAGPYARRLERQRARIGQGVASGQLTRREARMLRVEHRRIARERRMCLANDGRLGRFERARLNRDLGRASHHIYRLKHNRWRRV